MKRFKQLDVRWSKVTIGSTNLTVGRWGCTLTSICNLITRLSPEDEIIPSMAAKEWNYTKDGLLIWSTPFEGIDFVGRYHERPPKSTLQEWHTKDKGMIIEVNYNHWVVLYYYGFWGAYIIDPLDGKTKNLYANYTPTGYALFKSKNS